MTKDAKNVDNLFFPQTFAQVQNWIYKFVHTERQTSFDY